MASKKDRSVHKPASAIPASAPPKAPVDWRPHLIALAIVWIVALAAYANSFSAQLTFDSGIIVQNDARIRAVNSQNLDLIWSKGYWPDNEDPTLFRPLTTLSYLFNYSVLHNGGDPVGYHWVNFLLHAVDASLVYCLGLVLFGERNRAAALAALWAVHPVLTESVTYIAGRADMLAAFGVLAGLLCHVRAGSETGRRRLAWLAGVAASSAIGMFSKESGIVLIALMLVYDLAFRRGRMRAALPAYAAAALPVAIFLYQRSQVLATLPMGITLFVNNPLLGLNFVSARMTAIQVIGRYILLVLWPARLSADYSYNQIPLFQGTFDNWGDWAAVLALLACLALAGLAAYWYRRNPAGFFLIALFFVALAPVANIALLIGTIMAERFLYLPAIGLIGCVVWAVYSAADRMRFDARLVLGLLCLALVARTHFRNSDWQDSQALFGSAAQAAPNSYKNHLNLAVNYVKILNDADHAVVEGERSLSILKSLPPGKEQDVAAYANIGAIFRAKGLKIAKAGGAGTAELARQWFQKSLNVLQTGMVVDRSLSKEVARRNEAAGRPTFLFGAYQLYEELGKTYIQLGDSQKALEALEYGSVIRPDPQFFQIMSQAYNAEHDSNGAAIALMEGQLLHPDEKGFASELVALYQKTAPMSCAVTSSGGATSLNVECPLVHGHFCAGVRLAGGLYDRRGQTLDAQKMRITATQSFGCPAQ